MLLEFFQNYWGNLVLCWPSVTNTLLEVVSLLCLILSYLKIRLKNCRSKCLVICNYCLTEWLRQ